MSDRANLYSPGYHSREKELVPRTLLWAMFALAMSALAITVFAVVTDRPPEAPQGPRIAKGPDGPAGA